MEIVLGIAILVLVALAGALGWFWLGARQDAMRAEAELAAAKRSDNDFDRLRRENIEAVTAAARAASLEAAQGVSSKLLEDHKRETDAAKADSEKRTRDATEGLLKEVGGITKAVATLHTQLQENRETVGTLWRALESPGAAGEMAQVGLANALKAFGLETPRDYVLQYTTEDADTGKRLRPDAVIFPAPETLLVVDCKASKFLLEIAQADGTAEEAAAYENLKRTMNTHLRSLMDKDYRSAIFAAQREAGRGEAAARVHMMMFLPNDAAMEKLSHADAGFRERARAAGIIVGGPDVLYCALSLAASEIKLLRRIENHEEIVKRTGKLLDGIAIALGKAADVGKHLKRAAESFDEFSRSTNKTLLPRARNLTSLGVESKSQPGNLPAFTVHTEDSVIEGEAEELPFDPPRLER